MFAVVLRILVALDAIPSLRCFVCNQFVLRSKLLCNLRVFGLFGSIVRYSFAGGGTGNKYVELLFVANRLLYAQIQRSGLRFQNSVFSANCEHFGKNVYYFCIIADDNCPNLIVNF